MCVCQAWSVHNCLDPAQAHRCFGQAFAVVVFSPLKVGVASPVESWAEVVQLGAVAVRPRR